MKLAVIVPCYKMDEYINDFIESLVFLKDINHEVIFVNDEPGKKLNINTKYKVVNNKINKGLLLSRYEGYKNISDDVTHITFVDPDDKFNNSDWINEIGSKIINFSYNEWYKNKLIYTEPNGSIGPQKLDNHLWGIMFPIEILKKYASLIGNDSLSDDFPIKEVISRENEVVKSKTIMIDYRMRKSSISKSKFSYKQALNEYRSWLFLFKKYSEEKFINRAREELFINKRSFDKNEFKELSLLSKNYCGKFNGTMYRVTKFGRIKNSLKMILLNRKMHK